MMGKRMFIHPNPSLNLIACTGRTMACWRAAAEAMGRRRVALRRALAAAGEAATRAALHRALGGWRARAAAARCALQRGEAAAALRRTR